MYMIFVILFILIFILLMPIGIRFIYDDNRSDVDIYFYRLFNYRLDLDEFIKYFITEKSNRNRIDFKTIVNNIEVTIKTKKLLLDIINKSRINKSTIILKENYENIWTFMSFWNVASIYSNIINSNFQSVKNEYYMIANTKREMSFEIVMEVRLIKLFVVVIKDYKEVIKFIKIKRRQKKNGKSYL